MAKPKLRKQRQPSKEVLKGLPSGKDHKPSRRKISASEELLTRSSDQKKEKSSRMPKTRSGQSHPESTSVASPSKTSTSRSQARSKSSGNTQSSKSLKTSEKSSHQKPTNGEKTDIIPKTRVNLELLKSTQEEKMPLTSSRTDAKSKTSSKSTRALRRSRSSSESTRTPYLIRTLVSPMVSSSQERKQSHSRNPHSLGTQESSLTSSHSRNHSNNAKNPSFSSKTSSKSKVYSVQNGAKSHSRTSRSSESTLTSCFTEPPKTARTSYQEDESSLSKRTHSLSRKSHSVGAPELRTPLRSTKRPRSVRTKVLCRTTRTSSQSLESSHQSETYAKDKGTLQSTKAPKSTRTFITPQSKPYDSSAILSQNLGKISHQSFNEHTPVKTFHNSYEEYVRRCSPELNQDATTTCDFTKDVRNDFFENKESDGSGAEASKSNRQTEKSNEMEIDVTISQPVSKESTTSRTVSDGDIETFMDCVDAEISAKEITQVRHNTGRVSVMHAAVQVKMIGNEAIDSLQVSLDVKQNKRMICERDPDTYKPAYSSVLSENALTELIISELERQKLVEKFQGHEKLLSSYLKDISSIKPTNVTVNGSATFHSSSDTPPVSKEHDVVYHTKLKELQQKHQEGKKALENPESCESNTLDSLPDIQASSKQLVHLSGADCDDRWQHQPRKGMKSLTAVSLDSLSDIAEMPKQTLHEVCKSSTLSRFSPKTQFQTLPSDKSATQSGDDSKLLPTEQSSVSEASAQPVMHNVVTIASPVPTALSEPCSLNLMPDNADSSESSFPNVSKQCKDFQMSGKPYKRKKSATQTSAFVSEPSTLDMLPDFAAVTIAAIEQDESLKDIETSNRKSYPLRHSKSILRQEELPEMRPKKRMKLQSQIEGTPVQKIHSDITKNPSLSKSSPGEIETSPVRRCENTTEPVMNKETTIQDKSSRKKTCKGYRSQGIRSSPRLAAVAQNSVPKVPRNISHNSEAMTTDTYETEPDLKAINTYNYKSEVSVHGVKQKSSKSKSASRKGNCHGIESGLQKAKQKGRNKRKSDFNVTKLSEQLDSQLSLNRFGTSPPIEAKTSCPRIPESPSDEPAKAGSEEGDSATDNDIDDPLGKETFKLPAPNTSDSMIDMMNNMLELSPVVPPCVDVDIYTEMCGSLGGERSDEGEVSGQDLPLGTAQEDEETFDLDSNELGVSNETMIDLDQAPTNAAGSIKRGREIAKFGKYTVYAYDGQESDSNEYDLITNVDCMDDEWLVLDTVSDSDEKNDVDTTSAKGDIGLVTDETAHSRDKERMETKSGTHDSKVVNTVGREVMSSEHEAARDVMQAFHEGNVTVDPQKKEHAVVKNIAPEDSFLEVHEEAMKRCEIFDHKCEDIDVNSFESTNGLSVSSIAKDTVNETEYMNPNVAKVNVKSNETKNINEKHANTTNSDDNICNNENDIQTAKGLITPNTVGKEKVNIQDIIDSTASKDIDTWKAKHDKLSRTEHNPDVGITNDNAVAYTNVVKKTKENPNISSAGDADSSQVECDDTIKTGDNTDTTIGKSNRDKAYTSLNISDAIESRVIETDLSRDGCENKTSNTKDSVNVCTSTDIASIDENELKMNTKSESDSLKNEDGFNYSLNYSKLVAEADDSGLCLLVEDAAFNKQRLRPRLGLVDYSCSSDEEL